MILPNKLQKGLTYFLLTGIAAFVFSRISAYLLQQDLPPFFNEMVEKAKESPLVLTKIGPLQTQEYGFNKNDLTKDTLRYWVVLHGTQGTMHLRGFALKQNAAWQPAIIDTVVTAAEQ